jgi:hypothetical protein
METSNAKIVPPKIKWVEARNKWGQLEGIGAQFHLGARLRRIGVAFKKLPASNFDLHQARDAIEKCVEKEWQRWQHRTTVI